MLDQELNMTRRATKPFVPNNAFEDEKFVNTVRKQKQLLDDHEAPVTARIKPREPTPTSIHDLPAPKKVIARKTDPLNDSGKTDIDISGKTGTSQVISRKKNDTRSEADRPAHLRPHAWFIAYAPSFAPEIAVAVR